MIEDKIKKVHRKVASDATAAEMGIPIINNSSTMIPDKLIKEAADNFSLKWNDAACFEAGVHWALEQQNPIKMNKEKIISIFREHTFTETVLGHPLEILAVNGFDIVAEKIIEQLKGELHQY